MPQPTMAHGFHEMSHVLQFVQVRRCAVAICNFIHDLFLQLRSDPARRAKAAALVREEIGIIAHNLQYVASPLENGKGPRCWQILK